MCVPVDPERAHEFDPATVPSVGQLLKELDQAAEVKSEETTESGEVKPASKLASGKSILSSPTLFSHPSPLFPLPPVSTFSTWLPSPCFHLLHMFPPPAVSTFSTFPENKADIPDWEKTSLRPYVEMLESHARGIVADVNESKRRAGDEGRDVKRVKGETMEF